MASADCRPAGSIPAKLAADAGGAEGVALALLDREGDGIAGALGVLDGLGRRHAHVGKAGLEVMAAQQLPVALDALGIVEGGALEDIEPAGLAGGDDVAQLALGVMAVADEGDAVDLGDLALPDDENNLHAAFALRVGLGLDRGAESALAPVEIANAHGFRARTRDRVGLAGLQPDHGLDLGLVDGGVALDGHSRHDRVLDQVNDDRRPAPLDPDIGVNAGREQGLDRLVGLGGVVGAALGKLEAGAHRLGIDAAVALDLDGRDRVSRLGHARTNPAQKQGKGEQRGQAEATHTQDTTRNGADAPGKASAPPRPLHRRGTPCPKPLS